MTPGLKLHQGHPAGRYPREMTKDELRAAGTNPCGRYEPSGLDASTVAATRKRRWRSVPQWTALHGRSEWEPILGASRRAMRGGRRPGGL
jgi:hypothetical protein